MNGNIAASCPLCSKSNTVKVTSTALHEVHFCYECGKSFMLKAKPTKKPNTEST